MSEENFLCSSVLWVLVCTQELTWEGSPLQEGGVDPPCAKVQWREGLLYMFQKLKAGQSDRNTAKGCICMRQGQDEDGNVGWTYIVQYLLTRNVKDFYPYFKSSGKAVKDFKCMV